METPGTLPNRCPQYNPPGYGVSGPWFASRAGIFWRCLISRSSVITLRRSRTILGAPFDASCSYKIDYTAYLAHSPVNPGLIKGPETRRAPDVGVWHPERVYEGSSVYLPSVAESIPSAAQCPGNHHEDDNDTQKSDDHGIGLTSARSSRRAPDRSVQEDLPKPPISL
jgi:hypothetical protein